jgi:hypothetical protein
MFGIIPEGGTWAGWWVDMWIDGQKTISMFTFAATRSASNVYILFTQNDGF